MREDISGWVTRLTDEEIARHTASGAWRNITLADCALRMARRAPDKVAVVDGAHRLTFGQLLAQARRLAAAFAAMGLEPGEVVSFQLPNWSEAMVLNLAACLAGLVVNPIVPIYREAEVRYILKDVRAKAFFIPRTFRNFDYLGMALRLRPELPELREIVIVRGDANGCTPYDELLEAGTRKPELTPRADPNAVKLVLYTSGTTGNPKGVLHSHNTIMSEIDAVIGFWGIHDHDVVLMPSPVTHITGYLYALEIAFAAGVTVVFMERWKAAEAVELIVRHGVSFSVGATPFLKELVAEVESRALALPSLRLFMSGGAPVPPELIDRANQLLPGCMSFRVYGSTEAPTVTLGIRSRADAQLGATTDGKVVNHEVRLADAQTGATVHRGEGEICTRGPEMMLGYTHWAHTQEAFDAGGYFHTGDLGYFVDGGYLCVSGRKKDLIIRGGENLSPKEIEDVLHRHPAIKEAAVVGMPHERLGEGVCAFVIPHAGQSVDVPTLAAWLESCGLAKQKFPERVELVEDLPRTASGKVQKNVLRERIAARIAQERCEARDTSHEARATRHEESSRERSE
jgi:acyl-CoA synthetase (AMP-forming)/AMP-acid ligase II